MESLYAVIHHGGRPNGTNSTRVRHGEAEQKTGRAPFSRRTHAVRKAIQRSQASVSELAEQYGINQKTVRKWRSRKSIEDAPMGPKNPSVHGAFPPEEEAACVAFRRHTLLPLDDCLYALQDSIPHLTRSSLHRLYQRHDISRLPDLKAEAEPKKKFKAYPDWLLSYRYSRGPHG